jgi:ParB family chromosome partitioning protein
MGKLDELLKSGASNIAESMGVGVTRGPGTLPSSTSTAPARWQGVTKSKNAVEIPVDKIDRDPGQPREDFDADSLDRLAESLRTRGQLQPIRVRWDEGRGVYVVVVGERRWRAARMAGLTTIAAVVMDDALEPGELLAIQLVENAVREDLRPIEQAKAFRALMDRNGWTVRQIAQELAIDHSNVVRALALLKLPESVQASVEAGSIAPRTAYELTKIEDPGEQAALAKEAAAGRLKRDDVTERARKPQKGRGVSKGHKVTSRVIRTTPGVRVTLERAKGLDDDLVRAALLDALGQLDASRSGDDQAAA